MLIWAILFTCYDAASKLSPTQIEKQTLLNTAGWSFEMKYIDLFLFNEIKDVIP